MPVSNDFGQVQVGVKDLLGLRAVVAWCGQTFQRTEWCGLTTATSKFQCSAYRHKKSHGNFVMVLVQCIQSPSASSPAMPALRHSTFAQETVVNFYARSFDLPCASQTTASQKRQSMELACCRFRGRLVKLARLSFGTQWG
jgi:hypothetical protein